MQKISLTKFNNLLSSNPRYKFKLKPQDNMGFIVIVYTNGFNKILNIKSVKYLVDISVTNGETRQSCMGDTSVDFHSYTNYCEKGFNENPMQDDMLDLLNAASGVAEEAAEIMSVVRKFVFHGKPFDLADFASESGDLTWFLANLWRLVGVRLSDVMNANKIKLDHRYPNGRNKNYKLNNRDKGKETKLINKLLTESGAYDTYNKNKIANSHAN